MLPFNMQCECHLKILLLNPAIRPRKRSLKKSYAKLWRYMYSDNCKYQDEDINSLMDLITRSKDVISDGLQKNLSELERKKSAHNCALYEEAIKWVRKIAAILKKLRKRAKQGLCQFQTIHKLSPI